MLFVIYATDKKNSLALRQTTRATHLAYMSNFDTRVGGPLLDEDGNMAGSMIVLEAEDLAAAKEFAANDPYRIAGLFESVHVTGFKAAIWPDTTAK